MRLPTLAASVALAALSTSGSIEAQAGEDPGVELTVYLLTMGPGERIYERFGHNAIWIRDRARDTDLAYNYGLYDFDQPHFVGRFILGRMLYWMAPSDAHQTIREYAAAGRTVTAQELALTPQQRWELQHFLEWNARPENRDYRYDYFYDNCSTRVRDALDRALGGAIREASVGRSAGRTLRWHARRLVSPEPLIYLLIQVALGRGTDRPIDRWEEMFLPIRLEEELRGITVPDEAGRPVPLVRAEQVLHVGDIPEPARPPAWVLRFLGAGLVIGIAIVAAAATGRRSRAGRSVFTLLAGGWGLVGGILGSLLAFLWLFTDHEAAARNENLLLLHPLLLGLAVLLPALAHGRPWGVRWAFALAAGVLALSILALLLKVLPGAQANAEILALVLPVHLAFAWSAYRLTPGEIGHVERAEALPADES